MVCTAVLATPATAKISVARQAELLHLLRQDCGSCHGTMTLRGGLGSPLTPAALADRPVDLLVEAVLDGRPGTPMAPWRILVNEEEATWLVEQLRAGLPAEH
jgi:cytochrome c55X